VRVTSKELQPHLTRGLQFALDVVMLVAAFGGREQVLAAYREAVEREYLLFFEHDPSMAAGYLREKDGKRYVERVI